MIGKDIAHFHRIVADAAKWAEDNPFTCPLSKHEDGNHSRTWFDGGTCAWCGLT